MLFIIDILDLFLWKLLRSTELNDNKDPDYFARVLMGDSTLVINQLRLSQSWDKPETW